MSFRPLSSRRTSNLENEGNRLKRLSEVKPRSALGDLSNGDVTRSVVLPPASAAQTIQPLCPSNSVNLTQRHSLLSRPVTLTKPHPIATLTQASSQYIPGRIQHQPVPGSARSIPQPSAVSRSERFPTPLSLYIYTHKGSRGKRNPE